jgi:hypothetical protein
MADSSSNSSSSLPLAGLAGIAAASLALLIAHEAPFLATRPPEAVQGTYDFAAAQRVEARLWQDPFSAVESFEQREARRLKFDSDAASLLGTQQSRTNSAAPNSAADAAERSFEAVRFGIPLSQFPEYVRSVRGSVGPQSSLGVLAVMMSGSHFVGAEEFRRRARYAVVSALGELDYAPLDNEHVGYVMVPLDPRSSEAVPVRHRMRMPFEAFRSTVDGLGSASSTRLPRNVLILWIDEAALNGPGAQGAWPRTLTSLFDGLGLRSCVESSAECFVRIIGPASSDEYASLAHLTQPGPGELGLPPLVSPYVTSGVRDRADVQAGVTRGGLTVIPTVGRDTDILQSIVQELHRDRDLPLCEPKKSILLFGEWDTEYGRRARESLARTLERRCVPGTHAAQVRFYSFVRGLDGVEVGSKADTTAADAEKTGASSSPSGSSASKNSAALQIEWPEGNDERDYLRRFGQRLRLLPDTGRTLAIGLFASDAHDKLLLLQALRERFAAIPFFTTDLDARLAHPAVRKWTRNLIVGSSFGLSLGRDIQMRTPPFRDSYQTAAFLATLVALQWQGGAGQGELAKKLGSWLEQPALFEVGRTRIVPLLEQYDPEDPSKLDSAAGTCGPATLLACRAVQPQHFSQQPGYRLPAALLLLFLGLVLAMWLWAVRSQRSGVLIRKGGAPAALDRGAQRGYPHTTTVVMSRVFLVGWVASLGLLGVLVVRVLVPGWTLLPIEPRLLVEGISSWPVALCWSFALVLTFVFLLKLFLTVQVRFNETEDRYLGGGRDAVAKHPPTTYCRWIWQTLMAPKADTLVGDKDRKSFVEIWATYRYNAQGWARLRRIWIFWLALFVIPFLLVHGHDLTPSYAVRGGLRPYVRFLNWADLIMLTVLMAAVADAVLLCTIFVVDLGKQRNSYPAEALENCVRCGLCSGLREHLDEYLDTCVVGDRTAAVAEYLYYPFVVLAVLAVSMTSLFDNWAFDWNRVGLYVFYGTVLGLLWLALHQAAVRARRLALAEMDIIWLKLQSVADTPDCKADAIRNQFERIMQQVRDSRRGAFGPLLRQPIFQALLWPLSGVSTAQLVGYFF